jgi:acetyl-CoA carboxylase biotin carboxyl carrier protein
MDLELVEKLLKLLSESNADEIEIEEEGRRVKVAKHRNHTPLPHEVYVPGYPLHATPKTDVPATPLAGAAAEAVAPSKTSYHEIRSPIVGTFYRAPAPDAAPFVDVGSMVQAGSVLCIVEAMKLMNEIESDVHGRIAKVMVENGQPVEYDQPLFLIEPA